MNEIKVFNNPAFGQIRTAGTSEEPLFCLVDVCKALELAQGDVKRRLDKGVVSTQPLQTAGGVQQANFVNEDGLYDVILDSRKPEAKAFRKWITSEVLPSIRKTGKYETSFSVPQSFSEALMLAAKQQEQIEAQQKRIEESNKEVLALTATVSEMQPKATYYDRILANKATVTVTQIAQDYGVCAKTFNKTLCALGIQRKVNGQWILYAKYQGQGYVHSKSVEFTRKDGTTDVNYNTEWTQKGRLFLYEKLKKHGMLPLIEVA